MRQKVEGRGESQLLDHQILEPALGLANSAFQTVAAPKVKLQLVQDPPPRDYPAGPGLRLHAASARGPGVSPGVGTRTPPPPAPLPQLRVPLWQLTPGAAKKNNK